MLASACTFVHAACFCCMPVCHAVRVTLPLVAPRRWFMLFARWHIYSAPVCAHSWGLKMALAEMHIPISHMCKFYTAMRIPT
jgi:hypothetical protein